MDIIKIIIKKDFKNDYISREAGERLRLIIEENYKDNKITEIDFSEIVIASTSFFDESLAKLISNGWNKEQIKKYVILSNINSMDLKVLDKMYEYRGLK